MGAWAGWFQEQVLNDANIHKIGYLQGRVFSSVFNEVL